MRSILFVLALAACSRAEPPKLDLQAAVCAASVQTLEQAASSANAAAAESDELSRCILLEKLDHGVNMSVTALRTVVEELGTQKADVLPALAVLTELRQSSLKIMEAKNTLSCAHTQNENYPKDRAQTTAKQVVAAVAAARKSLTTAGCR